jgi:hypothetical protein
MNKFNESVTRLLLNKELANEFGSAGKTRIIKNFSLERKVDKFLKLLSDDLTAIC